MGAGNDEDSDHPRKGSVQPLGQPSEEGNDAHGQSRIEQVLGHSVRFAFGIGLGLLGTLHQLHDLRQVAGFTSPRDGDGQGAIVVGRPADHPIAALFRDSGGFPGNQGFIHRGCARRDRPVGRNTLAGPNLEGLADLQLADRHVLGPTVRRHPVRRLRQQGRHLLQRVAGAHHRVHFDPMAQQHDQDQGRQFKREIHDHGLGMQEVVGDEGIEAVYIRHGDAHGDQGHHGRFLALQFGLRPLQEDFPAIEEDDRVKQDDDPILDNGIEIKNWSVQTHDRCQQQHRQGQYHRDPKLLLQVAHMHHLAAVHHHVVAAHVHIAVIHMAVVHAGHLAMIHTGHLMSHLAVRHAVMVHLRHLIMTHVRVVHLTVVHLLVCHLRVIHPRHVMILMRHLVIIGHQHRLLHSYNSRPSPPADNYRPPSAARFSLFLVKSAAAGQYPPGTIRDC